MHLQTRKETSIHFTKTILIALADAVCMPVSSVCSLNISFAVAAGISLSGFILEPFYCTGIVFITISEDQFPSQITETVISLWSLIMFFYVTEISFSSESIFSLSWRIIITFPLNFLWKFYDLICKPTFNFCIDVDSSHLTHEAFFLWIK